jgi:putative ABC transport system permease protein
MMTLYELIGAVQVGLIFGLVAVGAFLSFRVLDFPDLTVEGSFPLGAAVAATLIISFGWNPWAATVAAAPAGFVAGLLTAFLNVRYNILHILCGILVSIALYSLNLRIMGGPNRPLLGVDTVFSGLNSLRLPADVSTLLILFLFTAFAKIGLDLFLATGSGIAVRASGSNPAMAAANGIDVGKMKLIGLGIANALTAVAGALFAQLFGAADVYMGLGVVIVGLASVIVGMAVLPARSVSQATFACVMGALIYRLAVSFALNTDALGLRSSDVQLVTAVLVTLALIWQSRSARKRGSKQRAIP